MLSKLVELRSNSSELEISAVAQRLMDRYGFRYYDLLTVRDIPRSQPIFRTFTNAQKMGVERGFHENLEAARRDPVMQHLRSSTAPIVWSRLDYARAGQEEIYEEMSSSGYKSGVGLALHLADGRHLAVGIDSDSNDLAKSHDLPQAISDLQIFSVCVLDPVFAIADPELQARQKQILNAQSNQPEDLTLRELEILRWASEGKTAWETGQILSISSKTVVKHLTAAREKLNCVNTAHAIAQAFRSGLIS